MPAPIFIPDWSAAFNLSSRPKRTRISCTRLQATTACAAFCEESRMKFASATKVHRKSGGAKWRDLQFAFAVSQIRPPETLSPSQKPSGVENTFGIKTTLYLAHQGKAIRRSPPTID